MGKFYKLSLMILMVAATAAVAQSPSTDPLSFKSWKEQQQVEAQNQLTRVNNRLVLLKAGKLKPEDVVVEFNGFGENDRDVPKLTARAQKITSNDILARLEREQSRSQKNVEFAKDLGIAEYFQGYLIQFQENQAALAQIAGRLSKDEVIELLKVVLKSNHQSSNPGRSERLRSALNKLEANAANY